MRNAADTFASPTAISSVERRTTTYRGKIRTAYRESARQRSAALGREARNRNLPYALVDTNRPYLDPIEAYLGFRGRNRIS